MGLIVDPAKTEPAAFENKARKNRQGLAGLHLPPCSPSLCSSFSLLPLGSAPPPLPCNQDPLAVILDVILAPHPPLTQWRLDGLSLMPDLL